MKKNTNFITPLFLILVIVMFAMAVISFWWNKFIFIGEFLLSLSAMLVVGLSAFRLRHYISQIFINAVHAIDDEGKTKIENIGCAAAVIGENNEIITVNKRFRELICSGESPISAPLTDYLSGHDIHTIFSDRGTDTKRNDKWYVVFGVKSGSGAIVYFIDNDLYKSNSDEYISSRPVVAIVTFDNKEELERQTEEGKASQVTVSVEQTIVRWVASTTGFYKKISGGRYIVVMEERYIKKFMEEKFKVLEDIREIKINERVNATISIGVGHGGKTFKENELWARQALEIALGRDGDQVAVKQSEEYQFFGGVSKGVEKRDKVRTRVIAGSLITHVKNSSNVIIMGHRYSDLDAVGACIGMWSSVSKGLKKTAYICINRQQTLAKPLVASFEKAGFESIFKTESEILDIMDEHSLLIIVDTHSPNFLESRAVYERSERVVVIDHHRMMVNHIDNAVVFYHEPYASSACEMTAELIQYLSSEPPSRLESEAMLSGIMLDTKNFVLRTGVRTFEAAAYLRKNGADTVEVKRLFSNSIDTYKVKYKLVSDAEIFNYCAIACADEATPDIRIASAQAADELLGIENVKASFVMYKTGKTVNISARSLGDLNVQVIMESLGGGGHQTMAACQMEDVSIAEARERLVSIINDLDLNTISN